MNRGRQREAIFTGPQDYQLLLEVLGEAAEIFHLQVAAFCLMPNHYHLIIHTPEGNVSRCMRHFNGIYTQRFTRRYKVDSQLFRGRYKAVLIDADSYLLELLRYIHRNPLLGGLGKILMRMLTAATRLIIHIMPNGAGSIRIMSC